MSIAEAARSLISLVFSHKSKVTNDKSLKRRNIQGTHMKGFQGPTGKFPESRFYRKLQLRRRRLLCFSRKTDFFALADCGFRLNFTWPFGFWPSPKENSSAKVAALKFNLFRENMSLDIQRTAVFHATTPLALITDTTLA